MDQISASQAAYQTTIFWNDNKARDYKERIMFAISNAANGGAHRITWRGALSNKNKNWLITLGYKLTTISEDWDNKIFQYVIEW